MPALLFGSIGSIADTSELQREAFNSAFAEHGLDWNWDQDTYRELLASSGGEARIATQAKERGEDVDAGAVHRTKSETFRRLLGERPVSLRDGVADAVAGAKADGFKVGLVTTTAAENVTALLDAVDGLDRGDFDLVLDTSDAESPKPDPSIYALALERLDLDPGSAVAVEDNVGGVESAHAARLAVVAFPGENNAGHDFGTADRVVEKLDFSELSALTKAA